MKLSDIYQSDRLGLSFELFPPKTAEGETALWRHVEQLVGFQPDFITCTYGAGGSTRSKTLEIVEQVKRRFRLPVASHLTVVGSTLEQLQEYLGEASERRVDYIVALRGDPPRGESEFRPAPGGLRYANELVEVLRREFPQFGVAVAGYPEVHREAVSPDDDLERLKRKVDAGADVVITQLFYDNADFFRFRERYEAAGIRAPLVPGILPVTNYAQIKRIASLCGARLPAAFIEELAACGDDEAAQLEVGVRQAAEQVRELLAAGIPGLHFYVLNKSQATGAVLRAVGRMEANAET